MVTKLKNYLFSENGMKLVNVIFLLSMIIRNSVFGVCAGAIWLAFLIYSIIHTQSTTLKIVFIVLGAFAAAIIGLNLYCLITSQTISVKL